MNCTLSAGRLPDGLDLVSFFDGLVFFAPVALLVRTTAGVSAGQFFLLQAVISAASLAGELPCGRLTDRIGYRHTIRLCEGCFFLARALLLAAFLTRSLPLFVLEAAVEGLAISLESGTWDAYLYGALPPDRYLPKQARMENWGTAGFLVSTVGYVGLYAAGGLPALLGATVCASAVAFALSFTLPRETARREREAVRTPGGLGRLLASRQAWLLMGLLAALSVGRLLVNFFYAERLGACGLGELWMTPVILGYSCIQMLAAPILGRVRRQKWAVAGFCAAAGVGAGAGADAGAAFAAGGARLHREPVAERPDRPAGPGRAPGRGAVGLPHGVQRVRAGVPDRIVGHCGFGPGRLLWGGGGRSGVPWRSGAVRRPQTVRAKPSPSSLLGRTGILSDFFVYI